MKHTIDKTTPFHVIAEKVNEKGILQNYLRDFYYHDRNHIESDPYRKFILCIRENGSHLTLMHNAEDYPCDGEIVPFVFGQADREHILTNTREALQYIMSESKQFFYFDGENVHDVDPSDASRVLLQEYDQHIEEVNDHYEQKAIERFTDQILIAVGSAAGSYTPSSCLERFAYKITNADEQMKEDIQFLLDEENMDDENYLDAWINVLDNAIFRIDGRDYKLMDNEDLWLIPDGLEIPENWII